MMTFDELMKAWDWEPIRNCPGRYVLRGAAHSLAPPELICSEAEAEEFQVPAAKDAVLVLKLEKGGLISYRRSRDNYLHTLNTPEGFQRKLAQLGIDY